MFSGRLGSTRTTGKRAHPKTTPEGIALQTFYDHADRVDVCQGLTSIPGQPPFLRGPYATMYRSKPWTIRQYAGFSTAKKSNAFYRKTLRRGKGSFGGV